MAKLSEYNPFPPAVWVFIFLALTAGFFAGALVYSIAINKNEENFCNFIKKG